MKQLQWFYTEIIKNTTLRVIIILLIFLFSSLFYTEKGEYDSNVILAWMVNMTICLVLLMVISRSLNMPWYGFLIDKSRKRMSLSRLQLVTWTIVILSAYMAINFDILWSHWLNGLCCGEPRLVELKANVLMLLGISSGTALTTPIINQVKSSLTNKRDVKARNSKDENPSTFEHILDNKKEQYPDEHGSNIGVVYINTEVRDAYLIDIFRGEEVKDFDMIDISKVQNFIFTFVALTYYSYQIVIAFLNGGVEIPDINGNLLLILGISHSYYVINKVIPQSTPAKKLESSEWVHGTI